MIIPSLIIPTVLIPFTLLSVLLSTAASFIASIFGFHLSTEGPRRLLEALLKPRVLLASLALNGIIYGGIQSWKYYQHGPRFEFTVIRKNQDLAKPSDRIYADRTDESPIKIQSSAQIFPPADLQLKWSKKLPAGSFAGAVISSNSLFIGTDTGMVEEMDFSTGENIRSFYVGTSVNSLPTLFQGSLFAGEGEHETHHARIYKFDLKSGTYVGSFQTRGHTEGRTVIGSWLGKNLLFAPSGPDGMHAIDPETMGSVWHSQQGHTDASVAIADGFVFWGTGRERKREADAKVWAVAANFLNGNIVWKRELPASSWMQPTIAGPDVCFPVGEIYFPSEVGGIFCFNRESGAPSVSFNAGEGIVARAVLFGDDLIATTLKGRICRFSFASGRTKWCTKTDETDYSLSSVAYDASKNVLVYASRKAGVFVLDPRSGRVISQWLPKAPEDWKSNFAPAEIAEGIWITADIQGHVRSFQPLPKKSF